MAKFLKSWLHFEHFGKKMTLIDFVFPKLRTPKSWLDKYLKRPASEDASTSNMVNRPERCWNLYQGTSIRFIYQCEGILFVKSPSCWHARSWNCLLTHFAVDGKYPVLNRDNSTIPIQMKLSQKQKKFPDFFSSFLKSQWNFGNFQEKDNPHRFCIFEITDSENLVR